MKICWCIDFFLPHFTGGGQVRLYELARRLVAQGHEVTVVTMRHQGVEDAEMVEGIKVVHRGPVIKCPPQRSFLDVVRFFFAVRSHLKSTVYDVVCAEGMSLLPAYLFSRVLVVATVHDVSSGGKDQWFGLSLLSRWAEKLFVRLPFARVVTVSAAVKAALVNAGVSSRRLSVVYNAVDVQRVVSVPAKKLPSHTIIFVGRLVPHKHVDDVLAALKLVLEKFPSASLLVFGSGPEESRLKTLSDGLPVSFFTSGSDAEVIGAMKGAAVLVLPSTREGFGIVLAEAGVCGIPVVAYDIPAVREVVLDGKTGVLVRPSAQELSQGILSVLAHPKKARMMGVAARKYILASFDWDVSARKLGRIMLRAHRQAY